MDDQMTREDRLAEAREWLATWRDETREANGVNNEEDDCAEE